MRSSLGELLPSIGEVGRGAPHGTALSTFSVSAPRRDAGCNRPDPGREMTWEKKRLITWELGGEE